MEVDGDGENQNENNAKNFALKELYEECKDSERAELEKMYGQCDAPLLVDIARNTFETLRTEFSHVNYIRGYTETKLNKVAQNVKCHAFLLDGEQEKQLEYEIGNFKQ